MSDNAFGTHTPVASDSSGEEDERIDNDRADEGTAEPADMAVDEQDEEGEDVDLDEFEPDCEVRRAR